MFGRKKKSQPASVEAEVRGHQNWEHYTVTVSGFGTLGTEKATEVLNKMTGAG